MNTDDHDPNAARHRDEPVVIGSELRAVGTRLRDALGSDAAQVMPGHRLDAILAAAHERRDVDAATRRRRWLVSGAAAAAVVVVGGTVVVANRPSTTPVVSSPVTSTSLPSAGSATTPSLGTSPTSVPTRTAPPAVTVAPPTSPTGPTTTTSSAPPASPSSQAPEAPARTVSLPVYYAGPVAPGSDRLVLFREFVPSPSGMEEITALRKAVAVAPKGSTYVPLWGVVQVDGVDISDDRIVIALDQALTGVTDAQGAIAVQQLVWTAQAAAGKALPVRFTVADGATEVAPGQPTSGTYSRPTDPVAVYQLLSPLFIDAPSRGAVLKAGSAVKVTGVASTNEANVGWQVLSGDRVIASGAATAAVSAPSRGGFSIAVGPLPASDYVIRVFEESARDGSVAAEQRMPFTVR